MMPVPNVFQSTSNKSIVMEQLYTMFDVIIFTCCVVAFGIVYWFFLKKKNEEQQFAIQPDSSLSENENFIMKMKQTGRNVIVFYGSQTGTAEEFAARLAKEATRYGLKAMVADLEEYDLSCMNKLSEIPNSLIIFCMATYGEGDPTDNAQDFYQLLQDGNCDLTGVNYAVFGLGNKTYEHYNLIGKYVDKRLEELGATRIFELGLGDDDSSIEEDFIAWKEKFWNSVCEYFHIESTGEEINLRQYKLILHDDMPYENIYTGQIGRIDSFQNQKSPFDIKNPFLSPLLENKELYKGERSCMHIELDITGAKFRYETGDHVAIYPKNDPLLVEKMGKLLDVNLDTVFSLINLDEDSTKKNPFPCPTTYRAALMHYVDITSIPRTHVLKEIADYASNEEHKNMLKMMATSSEEGKNLYLSWVVKKCRTIIHILEDLPSLKPPLNHLLELLPRLHARYYSISSSPKVFPSTIHVTAVLVEYKTPTNRISKGVTTGWLKTLDPSKDKNIKIPIFVRRSQLRLPGKPQTPIIMIGPGTGLAPFRGFIQERDYLRKEGMPVGDTILYFGCRKQSEDFLYEDELKSYLKNGSLTKLYLAFSRDQSQKIYVTHLLNKNKEEIWNIIGKQNGQIYVCGDAKNMAKDVHNIILQLIQEMGQMSKSDAEMYLKKMESQRRYSADVWS